MFIRAYVDRDREACLAVLRSNVPEHFVADDEDASRPFLDTCRAPTSWSKTRRDARLRAAESPKKDKRHASPPTSDRFEVGNVSHRHFFGARTRERPGYRCNLQCASKQTFLHDFADGLCIARANCQPVGAFGRQVEPNEV
jgi:hypothetical protein